MLPPGLGPTSPRLLVLPTQPMALSHPWEERGWGRVLPSLWPPSQRPTSGFLPSFAAENTDKGAVVHTDDSIQSCCAGTALPHARLLALQGTQPPPSQLHPYPTAGAGLSTAAPAQLHVLHHHAVSPQHFCSGCAVVALGCVLHH